MRRLTLVIWWRRMSWFILLQVPRARLALDAKERAEAVRILSRSAHRVSGALLTIRKHMTNRHFTLFHVESVSISLSRPVKLVPHARREVSTLKHMQLGKSKSCRSLSFSHDTSLTVLNLLSLLFQVACDFLVVLAGCATLFRHLV